MGKSSFNTYSKSSSELKIPDLEYVMSPASFKEGTVGLLDKVSGMTLGVWQTRPKSNGYVKINSKNLNTKDKERLAITFNDILFNILGFNSEISKVEKSNSQNELVELLIKIRSQARNDKNFTLSDQIRDELFKLGIQLNDDKNSSSFELI